jgi:hypothetical protein
MGIDFYDVFVRYKYSVADSLFDFFRLTTLRETLIITQAFVQFMFDTQTSKSMTVQAFLKKHHFTNATIAYMDRICRITDGAGIERYTLYQFMQTFNQNMFYRMYQPSSPNDTGLFAHWKSKLVSKGVLFSTGKNVVKMIHDPDKRRISHVVTDLDEFIPVDTVIFATPLENLTPCVMNSAPTIHACFGPLGKLQKYTKQSAYEPYLSITFHWTTKVEFPPIRGDGSKTPWGILWNNLSEYFGQDHTSKTILSVAVVRLDMVSPHTRRTANDTDQVTDLLVETFRQINVAHGGVLPEPDQSILSPGVIRYANRWTSTDFSYMKTIASYPFPFRSPVFRNLYSVGTHNEQSGYAFTSIETAVSNGIAFCHLFDTNSRPHYPLRKVISLLDVVVAFVVSFTLTIILWFYKNT